MATIIGYFESAADTPLTGASPVPTIRIRRTDTKALVVTDSNMTEQGDGLYSFDFSLVDGLNYAVRLDGDPTAIGQTKAGGRFLYTGESGTQEARIETDIPAILVDTGTTLPAEHAAIQGSGFVTGTDSLEAIRDRGDAAWVTATGFSTHTPAQAADAVWDEPLAGHTTPGTAGAVQIAQEISTTHLSVSYDDAATSLDMLAWLVRSGTIISSPTALTITWRNPDGTTLFTATETDATLTAQGCFTIQNFSQTLSPKTTYKITIDITDGMGTVSTVRSVVTTS